MGKKHKHAKDDSSKTHAEVGEEQHEKDAISRKSLKKSNKKREELVGEEDDSSFQPEIFSGHVTALCHETKKKQWRQDQSPEQRQTVDLDEHECKKPVKKKKKKKRKEIGMEAADHTQTELGNLSANWSKRKCTDDLKTANEDDEGTKAQTKKQKKKIRKPEDSECAEYCLSDELSSIKKKKGKRHMPECDHGILNLETASIQASDGSIGQESQPRKRKKDKRDSEGDADAKQRGLISTKKKKKSKRATSDGAKDQETKPKSQNRNKKDGARDLDLVHSGLNSTKAIKKSKGEASNRDKDEESQPRKPKKDKRDSESNVLPKQSGLNSPQKRKKSKREVSDEDNNQESRPKKQKKQKDITSNDDPEQSGSSPTYSSHTDQSCADHVNANSSPDKGPGVGQWSSSMFDSADRQSKFLRLMGAFKKGANNGQADIFGSRSLKRAMDSSQQSQLNEKLERQYNQAMNFRLNAQKCGGLGFEKAPEEGKKFHIDTSARSKKFDD